MNGEPSMRFLGGVVVGAIITSVFAASMHDFSQIKDWPSWAQAYLASIALVIAIYIPWKIDERQRKRALEQEQKRAYTLAHQIKPEIEDIVFWADAQIDLFKSDQSFLGNEYVTQNIIAMKQWKISLPELLSEGVENAYLFSTPLARALAQMMAGLRQYNRHIDDTLDEKAPPLPMSYYRELLTSVLKNAQSANAEIRKMLKWQKSAIQEQIWLFY